LRVLVTGGAGFIGANVAVGLAALHENWSVVAFDNLRRRGSELNLPRLRAGGVSFVHGDVRDVEDLAAVGRVDAVVECSAEPSVTAGAETGLDYLVKTNLLGAYVCLEFCRRNDAQLLFLSTSRVYPIAHLRRLAFTETDTRLVLSGEQSVPGAGERGISEAFPLDGARSLYGATKLAAEHLIDEYVETFGLRAVVNRCGVVAGPWQMGKIDQGIVAFWLLAHHFGRPLDYIGLGGSGKQVRDLLHIGDLLRLIDVQLADPERWRGVVANVGGGLACSTSLLELTLNCREITGKTVPVHASAGERANDIPVYISDCTRLFGLTDWRPSADQTAILTDTYSWIVENERALALALGAD
jgi:CDP-paratose 2-epimerase